MNDLLRRIYDSLPLEIQSLATTGRHQVRAIQESRTFQNRMADVPLCDANGKNVLLVVVDCLRADHTMSGGYSRKTTPFLTSEFQCFNQCVSAAPWTFPSVPSILSGMYPHSHGAVFTDEFRDWQGDSSPSLIAEHVFTLPEILAKSGYEVFSKTAVDTSFVPLYGRFPDPRRETHAGAETMIDDCIDWWESTTGPKFGYIHLGDLHGLYVFTPRPIPPVSRRGGPNDIVE